MKKTWEEYFFGIQEMDEEHAVLLDLTEQAGALFADENMLFKCADIRKILVGLAEYTMKHFSHEEEYLAALNYEGLEAHKKMHMEFIAKLAEFTERVNRLSLDTQDDMIQELFEYLHSWLQEHIKKEDRKYVDLANGKASTDC